MCIDSLLHGHENHQHDILIASDRNALMFRILDGP